MRLEARSGDSKSAERLDWLTEVGEQAVIDIKESLQQACEPIRDNRAMVKFAEEQWVMKMRGVMREALFVRQVDLRRKGLKAVSSVVQPLVAKEAERVNKKSAVAEHRQTWLDSWHRQRLFGPSSGMGRGGGYSEGRQQWGQQWGQQASGQHTTTGGNWQWRRDGQGPVTCFNCGKMGHFRANCPLLQGGRRSRRAGAAARWRGRARKTGMAGRRPRQKRFRPTPSSEGGALDS